MLSPEQQVLASLAVRRSPDVERLRRWVSQSEQRRLVDGARHEGLIGMLHANLKQAGLIDQLNPAAREELAATYRKNAALNLKRLTDLERLLPDLGAAGVDVFVLKGAALLHTLYGDPGLRPMTDVDLLVDESRRDALATTLHDAGYRRAPFYPDTFSNGVTVLDVHDHLLGAERIHSRAEIFATGQRALLADYRTLQVGDCPAKALGAPQEVLYMCLHLLKHNAERLLWLIEINELVDRLHDNEWETLTRLAAETGQERPVRQVAFLARLLLEDQATARLRLCAEQPRLGRFERRVLSRRACRGSLPIWAPLVYFSPQRGVRRRFVSMFESLFPRPAILRQIFQDRQTGLWRLYCRRFGQLVERVLR